MMSGRNPRAPARVWVDVLKRTTAVLSRSAANDVILFGSQAMSAYMERAMASKDLDLIVPGVTLGVLDDLCRALASGGRSPTYDFAVNDYMGRRYPVGHVYLRHESGYPLVVEFFQTFLGFESRRLSPFLTLKRRWGLDLQVPTPEGIIATRLSFRPPERISAFNAARLSRFISRQGTRIEWPKVNAFLDAFGLRATALENIRELSSMGIKIPGTSKVTRP